MKYLDQRHLLKQAGILRVPDVTCVRNDEIRLFIIASDGVIRFYEELKEQYQNMIMKLESQPEKLIDKLKSYLKWLGDDR